MGSSILIRMSVKRRNATATRRSDMTYTYSMYIKIFRQAGGYLLRDIIHRMGYLFTGVSFRVQQYN